MDPCATSSVDDRRVYRLGHIQQPYCLLYTLQIILCVCGCHGGRKAVMIPWSGRLLEEATLLVCSIFDIVIGLLDQGVNWKIGKERIFYQLEPVAIKEKTATTVKFLIMNNQ